MKMQSEATMKEVAKEEDEAALKEAVKRDFESDKFINILE